MARGRALALRESRAVGMGAELGAAFDAVIYELLGKMREPVVQETHAAYRFRYGAESEGSLDIAEMLDCQVSASLSRLKYSDAKQVVNNLKLV